MLPVAAVLLKEIPKTKKQQTSTCVGHFKGAPAGTEGLGSDWVAPLEHHHYQPRALNLTYVVSFCAENVIEKNANVAVPVAAKHPPRFRLY